jgi:hypothetical protein
MYWCCLQESAGKVLLEQLEGPPRPPGRVSTTLQLAGLDVTANALLLHDGRQAHVYRISESDNSLTQLSQFESPGVPVAADAKQDTADGAARGVTVAGGSGGGCSMALYNDSVYRTAERRVEVCNLSGEARFFLLHSLLVYKTKLDKAHIIDDPCSRRQMQQHWPAPFICMRAISPAAAVQQLPVTCT